MVGGGKYWFFDCFGEVEGSCVTISRGVASSGASNVDERIVVFSSLRKKTLYHLILLNVLQ